VDGNASFASTSTDNTVTFIDVAPSVTINQALDQEDPTSESPISFTVVFSETVFGFDESDIDLSASSLSGLVAEVTGTGADYLVTVTGMSGNGVVVASVVAGAALDAAGQASFASTSTDNSVTFVGNVAPVAVADNYFTNEDMPLVIAAPGVLANDIDADHDLLTALVVDTTDHGTLLF